MKAALQNFTNQDLIHWLDNIDIPTFIGSSKRIYPNQGIKPIEVFNQFLHVIHKNQVSITYNKKWLDWNVDQGILFEDGTTTIADFYVFALGGGSWKITGSNGNWKTPFSKKGIKVNPFVAANCAYQIQWPLDFLSKHEGAPLKNLQITCNGKKQKGEAVITRFGLEGNAIYALSPQIQHQLDRKNNALIYLDLKPMLSVETIFKKLTTRKENTITNTLRSALNMSSIQINLLKAFVSKEAFMDPHLLSKQIKNIPLTILAAAPVDEAISTSGGIALQEIDENFQLVQLPNSFCIGEMLDWNAPTGGYLLQGCFSMGIYLGEYLNNLNDG